ncbi:hypothetical protein ACFX2K_036175 [Malus domestica]
MDLDTGQDLHVFDWANHHPGGELPLLSLAGQDVTDAPGKTQHPQPAWRSMDLGTRQDLQRLRWGKPPSRQRAPVAQPRRPRCHGRVRRLSPGSAWQHLDQFFTGFHLENYFVSEVSKDYRKLVNKFTKIGLFKNWGHGVHFSLFFVAMLFTLNVYGVLCSCGPHWLGSGELMGGRDFSVTIYDILHYVLLD